MSRQTPVRLPRFGLAAKLAGSLVAAVLACFAVFGSLLERQERRHLETLVSLSAERISDVVRSSAWGAMLRNDRVALYALIRDFGREPGIRRVRIISEEGQVRHSTQSSEVGAMVDKRAEACYACHASSQPLEKLARRDRARIFLDQKGRRTLGVILPIENAAECSNSSCHFHPPGRRILGVIDVHLALEAIDAQLAEHRRHLFGFTAAAALLTSLIGLAFVWYFVHRPVRELLVATVQLRGGRLAHRLAVRSSDELGVLADSFNKMAEDLDQARRELLEWNKTLEDRVSQKTSELAAAHRGLVHSEKFASLGRLAAAVAHEVNNPLFGMLTYARLALKDLARPELDAAARQRMIESVRVIESESRRCGDLMKNLLAFARQSPPQRAPAELNTVVERAVRLVHHQFDLAQTQLVTDFDPSLPEIHCDAGQIQQILVILLVNAAEALGKGGTVRLRTAVAAGGEAVLISVKDDGPGVAPELQQKIFEPFFTTKESSNRTGLGLAIAKGIVEAHGGSISLESAPGAGAEFRVELPLKAPADQTAALEEGALT